MASGGTGPRVGFSAAARLSGFPPVDARSCWMLLDAEELRRRCGRLHGRLVAQPPARGDADVVAGLHGLKPALCGLLEALSQTLPKGQVQ